MKRGNDGAAAAGGTSPVCKPSLHAEMVHRLVLHGEPVVETVALGNDGTLVQRSERYWAITAGGGVGVNGVALLIPAGCRGPVSLMNSRAVAPCTGGLVMLDTSRQAIISLGEPVVSVHQLFESDVIIVRLSTTVKVLCPDGSEFPLTSSSVPVSVAHDSAYQAVDVAMADHSRYRFTEPDGWIRITLPGPTESGALLSHFNVKSGASCWVDTGGDLVVYHLGDAPVLKLPLGHHAMVTSSPAHIFVLNDTAVYPSVVPEVSMIDALALNHAGTLFPDQILATARIRDSDISAIHYPFLLWRNALFVFK